MKGEGLDLEGRRLGGSLALPGPAGLRGEPMLCTGCGHDSRDPILPPSLGCCPDSRYRTLADFLEESCKAATMSVLNLMLDWAIAFQRRTVALEASNASPAEASVAGTKAESETPVIPLNKEGSTPGVPGPTQHREIQKRQPCVLQDIPTGRYFVGILRGTVTWTDDIEKAVVHPKKGWIVNECERLIPVKVIPVPLPSPTPSPLTERKP